MQWHKTSPARRLSRAIELRKRGLSWREIGIVLGGSFETIRRQVLHSCVCDPRTGSSNNLAGQEASAAELAGTMGPAAELASQEASAAELNPAEASAAAQIPAEASASGHVPADLRSKEAGPPIME